MKRKHDLRFEHEALADVMSEDDLRLDHIPDVAECRKLRREFEHNKFWPNVFYINDHGNVDQLVIGWNGAKIYQSWV